MGFEPTNSLRRHRISSAAPSTTRTTLQQVINIPYYSDNVKQKIFIISCWCCGFQSCQTSKNYVEKVMGMSENMTGLMEHSADMIMEIKNSLAEQNSLMNELTDIFDEVNQVSDHLRSLVEE